MISIINYYDYYLFFTLNEMKVIYKKDARFFQVVVTYIHIIVPCKNTEEGLAKDLVFSDCNIRECCLELWWEEVTGDVHRHDCRI